MRWERISLETECGKKVEGIAPLIITASRATEVPAFYGEWFLECLAKGYVRWKNPFNRKVVYVSLDRVKFIVFWTKHCPSSFYTVLDILRRRHIEYYFQYTLNDYETENYEPGLPSLGERIDAFLSLSHRIGKERVIWRFDPLVLTDYVAVETLLERIQRIGALLHTNTERLVVSFADIDKYARVKRSMETKGIRYREWKPTAQREIARGIQRINESWRWL